MVVAGMLLLMVARVVRFPRAVGTIVVPILDMPLPVVARVVVYVVALVLLFSAYAYAIYSVRLSTSDKLGRGVVVFTVVLSLIAVLNRDLFSNDVYMYIFYGRMFSGFGLNPYVVLPADAPNDPVLSQVDWRNLLSPYGPLWTSWSALLDWATPGGTTQTVAAFKLAAAATHVVNTLLIGAIVHRVSRVNSPLAMAAYGWNPLTITEFAGNAHNDSLMLMWILAALLAYHHRRPLLGAALIGLAVATKFTGLLFVPFYLIALVRGQGTQREKIRRSLILSCVMFAVLVAAWLPYVGRSGWTRIFHLPDQAGWYLNSLPKAAYTALRDGMVWLWGMAPVRAGDMASALVTIAGLALILIVGWWLGWKINVPADLVEMWFWFLFAYLFFVGPYFWPWYATSLVSLAAMSSNRYVWIVTTSLSLSAMLVYSCSDCRTYLNASDSALTGLAIFIVPLIMLAALLLRRNSTQPVLEGVPRLYG